MQNDRPLRELLARMLDWGEAHAKFADVIDGFPPQVRGVRPPGVQHSAWELLEHLRIALHDILEFSRDESHASPEWPAGYWPPSATPPDERAWDASVAAIRADLDAMARLATDESTDLFAPIPHGNGQTILRELILAADHNAWHLGQLMLVRRMVEPPA